MQEPFSSLPSASPEPRQGLPDVRAVTSTEGLCDQLSIVSGSMTGSDAASVASDVLPSSSASCSAIEQQQQMVAHQIPAIEPHNPFFDNLPPSIIVGPPGQASSSSSCQEGITPALSLKTSLSSDAPYRMSVNSPAHSTTNPNPATPQQMAALSQPPERTGQPSTTASSEAEEDNDEDTAPSSTGRAPLMLRTDAISRLIENTKRFLQRKDSDEEEDDRDSLQGVLIAGYLQKLGRNGKWQTRWFETDGECLSYYKNQKRSKLLATLELQKVGLIEIEPEDATECSFRIQVLGRDYHLRASTRGSCKDWVINLNRVREAKLGQGGVRLAARPTVDLLDPGTPKLMVDSNRQRTRAVDEQDQWDRLIRSGNNEDPTAIKEYTRASALSSASLSNAVVGRWSKRRTTLNGVGSKLSRWARSLKKYSCAEIEREKIFLDKHVHPPGHDDKMKKIKRPTELHERSISTASDYDARILS